MKLPPRFSVQSPRILLGLMCGIMVISFTGCQTFTLSQEDFHRQQKGEMVDPKTGRVVEAVGTVGYLGAVLGSAINEFWK